MSDKKIIPAPNINRNRESSFHFEDITEYSFCNCRLLPVNCSWPECICDICLDFRENCECLKDDEQK